MDFNVFSMATVSREVVKRSKLTTETANNPISPSGYFPQTPFTDICLIFHQ